MRLSHDPLKTSASFDDPNLVSRAGLVPVMSLAERAGLFTLAREHVTVAGPCAASAEAKIGCLVAGMAAGADSIDDMDVLRHGAMPGLFDGLRAPSTLGSFLRSLTFGNVRQLGKVSRLLLAELARRADLLPGADALAFADVDSMQRRVYGHAKQGAAFGHTKIQGKTVLVRGLNALAATVCTPQAASVIAATRLRGGSAGSARGAASLVAEAISAAGQAGCTGIIVARADSAFYSAAFTAACSRAGAHFSVTTRMDPAIRAAISDDAWIPIKYPRAIWDDQARCWVSDAEVAETACTAFSPKRKGQAVTARLIVRRVRDQNPQASQGTGELFPVWRYHAVFTDSRFTMLQAEAEHRDHAIIEQALADLTDGPLAHAPSGKFTANTAWLALADIAHNLLRAAGHLASPSHARARVATIPRDLIDVTARAARHGRGHLTLHLPEG
ncbi:MAG: IS1380 family transposase [Streptosporangiaceae bacterium]